MSVIALWRADESLRSFPEHLPVTAEQSQDGWSRSQAWGTTVHQWSSCEGKRRRAGLLPHLCIRSVRSDSWHPRADWTVRLHFLFPILLPPLSAAHSQGRAAVEQMLQIAAAALHRGPRRRSFHLCPVLDFPVWNGARVLKRSTTDIPELIPPNAKPIVMSALLFVDKPLVKDFFFHMNWWLNRGCINNSMQNKLLSYPSYSTFNCLTCNSQSVLIVIQTRRRATVMIM